MSKVSVTGAKSVMSEVIETMYELELLDITEYDGSWDGFTPGDSLPGADEVSSQLVTVRALQDALDVDEELSSERAVPNDPDARLETLKQSVNELDDRQEELRDRRRDIQDEIQRLETFADIGVPLDLLWGYQSLTVLVGEGNATEIETALTEAGIDAVEIASGETTGTIAVFARADEGRLRNALVGVPFTEYEIPEETGDPAEKIAQLRQEQNEIEAEEDRIENERVALRAEHADFLLTLERDLRAEAEKREVPLSFATTERSFIIEGWVPTANVEQLRDRLTADVDGRVSVSEFKKAAYTPVGNEPTEVIQPGPEPEPESETAADRNNQDAVTDGGHRRIVTVADGPPTVQKTPKIATPFETLTKAVNRPKYSEFDPTIILFLFFPVIFGFMIADIGYGLVYGVIGYGVQRRFDSTAVTSIGAVMLWMSAITVVFGVLFGELFGLKVIEWLGFESVLSKGLTKTEWAVAWLLLAVVVGWLQMVVAYGFNFVSEYQLHGIKPAVFEAGSWLLILNGIWVFVFSRLFEGSKPTFTDAEYGIVGSNAILNGNPIPLGFTGFPALMGWAAIGAVLLGALLLLVGPWYEIVEIAVPFTHVLSYTRVAAVLLSKGGLVVAVNLLYFGAYRGSSGGFKFIHSSRPDAVSGDVIFGGLSNIGTELSLATFRFGLEGAVLGLPVLIAGHLIVLAVGGTAAIQAVRLEYFEFFEKFYDGGGRKYTPFGQ